MFVVVNAVVKPGELHNELGTLCGNYRRKLPGDKKKERVNDAHLSSSIPR